MKKHNINSFNCLASTHPEVSKQWHPTKNLPLTPYDITYGSGKKIWWKCNVSEDHIWEASINNRSKLPNKKCPYCCGQKTSLSNCLATLNPKLAKEWHPEKNTITPYEVTLGSGKKVWWKCQEADDHEWVSNVTNRNNGDGCPYCRGLKISPSNCLATTHPELAKEWHPTKNFPLTPFNIVYGSGKRVWWKCNIADDHEWESSVNNRTNGNKCPCCSGHKVVLSNCLYTTHPHIAIQWHKEKNHLTPFDVVSGSDKKAWWKCKISDDHEWQSTISSRVLGNGCACCYGRQAVLSNCLITTHPDIAKQWHPTKNLPLTPYDVVSGSEKRIWWKCDVKDHEWNCMINSRAKGSGCPMCSKSRGEKRVQSVLDEMKINYNTQKTFDSCKYKLSLHFDFYLPDFNMLIEYDGRQHFTSVKYFGGIEGLKYVQKLDKIKNKFAKNNNIRLLRIPYTKFDKIKEELMDFLGIECQYKLF